MPQPALAIPAFRGKRDLRPAALLAAVLLLAVLPRQARSQQAVHVEPGTRIRVTAPPMLADPLPGWLVELRADTLVFATPQTQRIAVSRQSVRRLELTMGRDRWDRGLRGGMAGLLLGTLAELTIAEKDGGPDGPCFPCVSGGYAFSGLVLGATLGALLAPERWERVGR